MRAIHYAILYSNIRKKMADELMIILCQSICFS